MRRRGADAIEADAMMPKHGPFHPGELAIQEKAGVRDKADLLGQHMLNAALAPTQIQFMTEAAQVITGHCDDQGLLWAGLIAGKAGFAAAAVKANTLQLRTAPGFATEHSVAASHSLGLLFIDPARRYRLRVNGTVKQRSDDQLTLTVDQAYGNCSRYIRARQWPQDLARGTWHCRQYIALTQFDRELIRCADTFFLATSSGAARRGHATSAAWGADVSHRGGEYGFLREEEGRLVFDDFPGNNLYNSLGNLQLYPYCGILLIDFDRPGLLQLSGKARLTWQGGRARIAISPLLVRRWIKL